MPDNVMLLYQPPHSPQVNSSEQLWDWSKDEIANRGFPGLDCLKLTLKELFSSKQISFFSSLTSRGFIRDALQKIGMIPAII
jgi:hypothetical protein